MFNILLVIDGVLRSVELKNDVRLFIGGEININDCHYMVVAIAKYQAGTAYVLEKMDPDVIWRRRVMNYSQIGRM